MNVSNIISLRNLEERFNAFQVRFNSGSDFNMEVADSATIDLTLIGEDLTASVIDSSITNAKIGPLAVSNSKLGLASVGLTNLSTSLQTNINSIQTEADTDQKYYRAPVVDAMVKTVEDVAWSRIPAFVTESGQRINTVTHGVGRSSAMAGVAIGADEIWWTPVSIGEPTTFDRLGINVTTVAAAGGLIRYGIHTRNPTTGVMVRALDAGEATSTILGNVEKVISTLLPAGRYWLAIHASLAVSVGGVTGAGGFSWDTTSQSQSSNYVQTGVAYAPFATTNTPNARSANALVTWLRAL